MGAFVTFATGPMLAQVPSTPGGGMGEQDIRSDLTPEESRSFTQSLLDDLRALEQMQRSAMFEDGVRRIGVEQELFLIGPGYRPAPIATDILSRLVRPEFTTELARFNLEINLAPLTLGGSCFQRLESDLRSLVEAVRAVAQQQQADVVVTGILPTLTMSDLSLDNMTPRERYVALNDSLTRMSGGCYRLHIQGTDELNLEHDSVMLEGCNTSFQVHLQVSPGEFPSFYNVAQAMVGPMLAAAVNSPILFGRRLWAETRIALFQQSIDTRGTTPHLRELTPRVRFGERWVRESVLEVFREDIARIPALVGVPPREDPFHVLAQGGVPTLRPLQVYNSTVYRWNRPCYGVLDGTPHLRIECRVLPAGPSIVDEVANAAFWIGLTMGGVREYGDITRVLDFDDARGNLLAAARRGLDAGFSWVGGQSLGARRLLLDRLVPLAREGLEHAGVDGADITRYLGIIEGRVTTGLTGARWLTRSLARMEGAGTRMERMSALTAALLQRQRADTPCHEWEYADIDEGSGWRYAYMRVEQYMTTDLFTVKAGEVIDLAALLMDWKRIRQVPVENDERRLVGLLSYGAVLRAMAANRKAGAVATVPVEEIMDPNPLTVSPDTPTLEAIRLMRRHQVTCLPVVQGDKLVGIVSVDDFLPIVERLLQHQLDAQ